MKMKLISMTDFVLEQANYTDVSNISEKYATIWNYANFLKQPLKLEMFVPCDENGNVWEYPPTKEEWEWAQKDSADAEQSFKQKEYYYEKAKEKVLFEGFEVEGSICFNGAKRISVDYGIFIPTMRRLTIEDLISDKKNPLQLTPTAIKQIGL